MRDRVQFVDEMVTRVRVYLLGNQVGTIKEEDGGWCYYPKGHKLGGEVFRSLGACKQSLEG